jgi:HSP20 family protein
MRRLESWDPIRELEEIGSRFNRLFGTFRLGDGEKEAIALGDWAPSCNISEDEKSYFIRAELPEVKREDVHVSLEKGILTIEGERKLEKEEKGVKFHRRELAYGKFVRRFELPEEVDETKIDAVFKDGMLNVTLVKTVPKMPKVREITVH